MARVLAFDVELNKLICNGDAVVDLAENDATAPLANLQVSLHTAAPGATPTQETNEVAYTSYARVAVARSAAGLICDADGKVRPAAAILFPAPTAATSAKATHIVIGTDAAGAGKALYVGQLTNPIQLEDGVVPRVEAKGATLALAGTAF